MSEENTNPAPEASETPVGDNGGSPNLDQEAAAAAEVAIKKEEKVAPKSTKKKYKLKVDKDEEEVEFDPHNDEEVKKLLQKGKSSDKRFQEAADVRKAALEFIDELKKNPRAVLSNPNIGIDVKKFAEQILNDELLELEKSPEQKEKEKLTQELEDLKKQAKDRDEQVKNSEMQRLQLEHERRLESEITAALDIGGLPKTPRTVRIMADYMMIALQNGIDLSPQDIAPIVKDMTQKEFKEVVNSLSDDQIEDFLGKEVIARLRKKNVAKAKAVDTANSIKSTGNDNKGREPEKASEKMTIRQFLKA